MVTLVYVYDFDILVIGSGPGGQKAAIAAAKLGRRVAIVERKDMVGGVCLNTGTIPSKTLREAVLYLTGLNQREMYGQAYRVKDDITIADLAARTNHVVGREIDVVRSQLTRNGIRMLTGTGYFVDANTVEVDDGAGRVRRATAEKIVIATGTRPARPKSVEFDEFFRTPVPHIYAVGDIIGFPALAATSAEQGRQAAHHACGEPVHAMQKLQPIGIYSIPEISYIGQTEEELTKENVPFEVGIARYRELARGQIIGDSYGVLKLLVSLNHHRLLGVHVFGTGATELVHIGQAVMGCGGTVDYLVDAVFNYPTLAEAYKVAALDAMNKIRQIDRLS